MGGVDGTLDFSRERLADLDENDLDEPAGLDPDGLAGTFGTRYWCGGERVVDNAAGQIDWNCDGDATDTSVAAEINREAPRLVLDGHDDWDAIRFDGGAIGAFGDDADPPAATRDEELTRDLAEELDVLTGDWDALLDGPATALLLADTGERHVELKVANVGKQDDTYTVNVQSDLPTLTAPESLTVAAGETDTLRFIIDTTGLPPGEYALAVAVTSDGSGELVGEHTVAVTVPDPGDPAVREDAEEALAWLLGLAPGEGPPA